MAASHHCELKEMYIELIDKKLSYRSMNVAQHIYWLVAGVLVLPEVYRRKLKTFTAMNERRIRFLAEAVVSQFYSSRMTSQNLDVLTLRFLIRVMGTSFSPFKSEDAGWVTPAMNAANCVRAFINQIATVSSESATNALESLISYRDMKSWHSYLLDAVHRQNVVRCDASFHHCTVEQILETLENRAPANVADLAALTFEYICETSKNIRHGNESGWRQYWNVDSNNKHLSPKPENSCRDTLLFALNNKFQQLGIDAQPEGHYADDKRSDIRVSYGGFNVPVEIKRSCHRDLWGAIKTQLIAKYTRDPGAEGYGIYLVFWFGYTDGCRPTPWRGPLPSSAEDLEKLLYSTLSEEHFKIKIHVIDVSPPDEIVQNL